MEREAFKFAFQFAKPLKVTKTDGAIDHENLNEFLGSYWLTSLGLKYKGLDQFEFVECVISINQEKNIELTPLQGQDGTVKEYISDGDYTIQIEAGINNNYKEDEQINLDYPIEKIKTLHKYLQLKDAIEVQSDFLDMFKIQSIVIKNYNLIQETHSNRQAISISALSDTPYIIKLKQEDVKTKF